MARPKTTFVQWLDAVGPKKAAALCEVTERTVYYWKVGSVKPGRQATEKILEAAPHLALADIQGIKTSRS